MLKQVKIDVLLLLIVPIVVSAGEIEQERALEIQRDIHALVEAATKLEKAWPWQGPIAEVEQVVKHGKSATPALVAMLKIEKPMRFDEIENDIHIEQQIELALCMIYKIMPSSGKSVYGVRSSDEDNWNVKLFWEQKVTSDTPAHQIAPAEQEKRLPGR